MLRSFRTALVIFIVAAAILPLLVVSIPFVFKIYSITREGAIKELRLTADQVVNDVHHELVFVSARFADIGQNKDMVLAANSPFFGFRAVALADEFVKESPIVESSYLLDANFEVVESVPEVTAVANIDRVIDAVRKPGPDFTRFRGQPFWTMIEDPGLIAELARNHHSKFVPQDKRILVLAMPLYFQHYTAERKNQMQGMLITLVTLDRLTRFSQRHLENYQSLALVSGPLDLNSTRNNQEGKQLAESVLKIETSLSRPLNLRVQVGEPNSVRFENVRMTLLFFSLFVVAVTAVFFFLAFMLARRLGQPLQHIRLLAQEYANGNYRPAIAVADFEEFQQVARTLGNMGQRIENQLEELRTTNDQLMLADKLKDDFLANTSHELRTPLHGIIGIASSLVDGAAGELSPKVHRNLRLIEQSGRRLENLVNDILDFAKIKNQALQLEIKPVEIFSLVDIVLSLHAAHAEKSGLKLINAVPRTLPLADADEFRLQQILHNLVGNALKFSSGGEVTVYAMVADGYLHISVEDMGVGIPADKLTHIFEPFVQVEGALTRSHAGSGLGLSITRKLVELHGGVLTVKSVPSKGSTFTFTLPLASDQEADTFVEIRDFSAHEIDFPSTEEHVAANASAVVTVDPYLAEEGTALELNRRANEAHVLVVDDEQINLEILTNYFFDEPYTLHKASSGPEALALLERLPQVELILLDVMMPKMSGFEVCSRIRANPRFDHVPILFLTARNQAKDIHQGFSYGGNDYLVKPISRVELLTRCQYHLHYARVKNELAALNISLEQKVETRTQELQKTLAIIQRNSNIFKTLLEVSMELQNREELSVSLRSTLEKLLSVFPNRGFGVALLHNNHRDIKLKLYSGLPKDLEQALDAALVEDHGWHNDGWLAEHNVLVLPLHGPRQIRFGDLLVWPAHMDTNEREVVDLYSRQLSAVVENRSLTEELERIAIMDPLTGAYNRRFFERAFSNVCYTFARHPERHFCLLSLDINGLKQTNDQYGHEAGDALIIAVVRLLQECLRQTDIICRVGGDEFIIIGEATGHSSCAYLCDRLEDAQQGATFEVPRQGGGVHKLPLRFSVGGASTEQVRPEELLRVADQHMYENKHVFYATAASASGKPGSASPR